MGYTTELVNVIRGERDSEEGQPWRCAACGVAVRKGLNDPCNCTRFPVGSTVIDPLNRHVSVCGHGSDASGPFVEVKLGGSYAATVRYPPSCLTRVEP